jgi:hypothetical protein
MTENIDGEFDDLLENRDGCPPWIDFYPQVEKWMASHPKALLQNVAISLGLEPDRARKALELLPYLNRGAREAIRLSYEIRDAIDGTGYVASEVILYHLVELREMCKTIPQAQDLIEGAVKMVIAMELGEEDAAQMVDWWLEKYAWVCDPPYDPKDDLRTDQPEAVKTHPMRGFSYDWDPPQFTDN